MKLRVGLLLATSLCLSSARAQTTTYDALVQQGKTQLQSGNTNQALASGQQAIQLDATRWEAYALTGGALMNLKRYEEAADQLSEAIKHAPEAKQAALRDLRKQCFQAESASPATVAAPAQAAPTTQAEIVLWKTIENSTNPDDFRSYLSQYPQGAFAGLARRHLAEIQSNIQAAKAAELAKLVDQATSTIVPMGSPETDKLNDPKYIRDLCESGTVPSGLSLTEKHKRQDEIANACARLASPQGGADPDAAMAILTRRCNAADAPSCYWLSREYMSGEVGGHTDKSAADSADQRMCDALENNKDQNDLWRKQNWKNCGAHK